MKYIDDVLSKLDFTITNPNRKILDKIAEFEYFGKSVDYCIDKLFSVDGYCTIDHLCYIGLDHIDTTNGFIIDKDGTAYMLKYQYTHGTVLSILYPDVTRLNGYDLPRVDKKYSIFRDYDYQDLEMSVARTLPIIRIAFGMLGDYISFGHDFIPTQEQYNTFKKFAQMYNTDEKYVTTYGELTTSEVLQLFNHKMFDKKME